jgi:hypothetical protein
MSITIKPSHKGKLHRKLAVPLDEKISAAQLEKAERSSSPAKTQTSRLRRE